MKQGTIFPFMKENSYQTMKYMYLLPVYPLLVYHLSMCDLVCQTDYCTNFYRPIYQGTMLIL